MKVSSRLPAALGVLACLTVTTIANAQKEFPPPQGKGRVVVVASGMSGPEHYAAVSREIAQLGYDVVLFDGNAMENTRGAGVRSSIQQAKNTPNGLPGKVALVGFSLGGGEDLFWGTQSSEDVAGAVLWYPATTFIKDVPGWAGRTKVPILMFAGEKDTFRDCCVVAKAHTLEAAAKAAGLQFELVTYPKTDHDFVKDGNHYNAQSYSDAFQRMSAKLKEFLAN